MLAFPTVGIRALRRPPQQEDLDAFEVCMARDLNDFHKVSIVRSVAFIDEQDCPFGEEFDGNDLSASHLLAYHNGEPVGTLRLRWFANFGKVERVCVMPKFRGSKAVSVLLAHAFEIAARKGYRTMIAQIQARLWPLWSRILHCELRSSRPSFYFSDFEYYEIDIPMRSHPDAIRKDANPYVMIRPEGEWDQPGVLEGSLKRTEYEDEAA